MSDPRPATTDAIEAGPTTANGPLADRPESVADRMISAQFADAGTAAAVRDRLLAAGIPSAAIRLAAHAADHPGVQAQIRPADDTLIGHLRDLVAPDDAAAGARQAVRDDNAVLEVLPQADQVEAVIRIIESAGPARFDPALERWRNNG